MPRSTNTTIANNNNDAVATKSTPKKVVKKVVKRVAKKKDEQPILENTEETNLNTSNNIETSTPVVENVIENNTNNLNDTTITTENTEEDISSTTSGRKKKFNKDDYMARWDYLFENYANELKQRKQPHQSHSILKYLNSLKNDTYKFMKLRKRTMENKANSGFMKPVRVSPMLEQFLDVKDKETPITRVKITQALCEYIKKNSLQNPEDRRHILPDSKLKELFDIQPEQEDSKLTYYSIQKAIQSHIFKLD